MMKVFASAVAGMLTLVLAVSVSAQPNIQAQTKRNVKDGARYKNPERFIANEFIVVLKPGVRKQVSVNRDANGKPTTNLASLAGAITEAKTLQFERQFPTAKHQAAGSRLPDLTGHYRLKIETGADLDKAMAAVAADPNVDHVEKIGVHELYAVPNDSFYAANQWSMKPPFGVDAETAWDTETGDPSVIIGIIDTGTRYFHEDLGGPNATWGPGNPQTNGNIFVNPNEIPNNGIDDDGNGRIDDTVGYDFIDNPVVAGCTCVDLDCTGVDNDPDDFNGHGTHVSGIAAAITNNTRGVAGVAGGFSAGPPNSVGTGVKILPLRIGYTANCGGIVGLVDMAAAAAAMNYVADLVDAGHNVVAVNCSWGSSDTGGLGAAVNALIARDVMVVHAAGNSNIGFPDFLGSVPQVVDVAGTSLTGAGYTDSNFGPWVDIAAPGVGIISTYRNSADPDPAVHYYATLTGTSMSAPHVCGVAALLESCRPSLTSQEKLDIMQRSSIAYSDVRDLGDGIVNANNAVALCGQDQKASQRPSNDGEAIASNIDWVDTSPNVIVSDDFVSDGRPITGVRWWGGPVSDVPSFILDDGVAENSIGVNDGAGTGGAFGWANQFQNTTGGAITLTNIQVAFGAPGGGTGVSIGNAVDAVIWVDAAATGNMVNATPLIRWSLPGGVHANDGSTFATHTIPGGAVIPAGAEFYVGCGDIQSFVDGVSRFPASIDETTPQVRSWAFFPPALTDPFDENLAGQTLGTIDSFGLPGNWLIRAFGDPAPPPDGWYLSFHEPLSTGGTADPSLGLYYCDSPIVAVFDTSFGACDNGLVFEYTADLADCCLIHANPDSRDTLTPAGPAAFAEVQCFDYALGVQATIGHRWEDSGGGCMEILTGNSADGNFWGWESTSNEIGAFFGLQSAFESVVSMSGSDWLYGPWNATTPVCSAPNMAFALFTTTDPGTENDANGTGVPDVCEPNNPPGVGDDVCDGGANAGGSCSTNADCPGGACGNKSRYITITTPGAAAGIQTIQVTVASMPLDPARVGEVWWAGASQAIANAPNPTLAGAAVQCEVAPSNAEVWPAGNFHLFGAPIVPGATYDVRLCDAVGADCSIPLTVATGLWGDVVAPSGGGGQPDFVDISGVVARFSASLFAPDMPRADLRGEGSPGSPNTANGTVDFTDIAAAVDAFSSVPYPFIAPSCP